MVLDPEVKTNVKKCFQKFINKLPTVDAIDYNDSSPPSDFYFKKAEVSTVVPQVVNAPAARDKTGQIIVPKTVVHPPGSSIARQEFQQASIDNSSARDPQPSTSRQAQQQPGAGTGQKRSNPLSKYTPGPIPSFKRRYSQ